MSLMIRHGPPSPSLSGREGRLEMDGRFVDFGPETGYVHLRERVRVGHTESAGGTAGPPGSRGPDAASARDGQVGGLVSDLMVLTRGRG